MIYAACAGHLSTHVIPADILRDGDTVQIIGEDRCELCTVLSSSDAHVRLQETRTRLAARYGPPTSADTQEVRP